MRHTLLTAARSPRAMPSLVPATGKLGATAVRSFFLFFFPSLSLSLSHMPSFYFYQKAFHPFGGQQRQPFSRSAASAVKVADNSSKLVTLIPGDGIGPETAESVMGVLQAADAPISFEVIHDFSRITHDIVSSIARNGVCLKGPLLTSFEHDDENRNMILRKSLNLYANIVPIKNLPGIKTRHKDVDIVVVRENTEGEYSGLEQEVTRDVVQSLKVTTKPVSLRIAKTAFEYAVQNNRKSVCAIHKANIQKMSDGLFLESCREIAKSYPNIEYKEMIIDNTCMQLIMRPQQFDIMVCPNLYGNVVINVASALIGGPGVVPGINLGLRGEALFEPGARHVAKDIEGSGMANPIASLLSAVMMLNHLQFDQHAARIEKAIHTVLARGHTLTKDIGGLASTKEVTKAIINSLE
ncbi:isocitrate dehydrogenase (NAD(+)) idh1 [Balamuthia mandrillaris]